MIRFRLIFIFLIFLGFFANAQCDLSSGKFDIMVRQLLDHSIDAICVKELQAESNALILDARAKEEFEISHIEDAQWVGYENFNTSFLDGIGHETKIIVYCSVGYRSEKIAEKITALGYTDVYNLYGGIFEWINQDLPVCNELGITQEIHPYDKIWGLWLSKGIKKTK